MVMLTQLAEVLREAGCKVEETDGWRTRGHDGPFDPEGVLWHHTVTGPNVSNDAVRRLLIVGRSDLPGPLCNLGLKRDGTFVVIAAGRAYHAGKARASGTMGAGDGNTLYIGIEAYNSGVGEPWPQAQRDAYDRGTAAICQEITGNSAGTVRGHRETSVTGKIDPAGIDMDAARARVQHLIEGDDDMADEKTQKTLTAIRKAAEAGAADAAAARTAAEQTLTEQRAIRRGTTRNRAETRKVLEAIASGLQVTPAMARTALVELDDEDAAATDVTP